MDGKLLVRAGEQIAVSAPSDAQGLAAFDCGLPIRGELYGTEGIYVAENEFGTGTDARFNSGLYEIRELTPPIGYYLNDEPMEVSFLYDGQPVQTLEVTCKNDGTSVLISKRKLTGSDELPGATLRIVDQDGKVIREWVSGDKATEIRGLELDKPYTLVEITAPQGFAVAESISFKLVQRVDEDGSPLHENDVYVCTGKDWLVLDHWTLMEDGMVVMRDAPAPEQPRKPSEPEKPKPTPVPQPIPQTGDLPWLPAVLILGLLASVIGIAAYLWHETSEDEKVAAEQWEDE